MKGVLCSDVRHLALASGSVQISSSPPPDWMRGRRSWRGLGQSWRYYHYLKD